MVDGLGVEQAVILNIRPVLSPFPRASYPRVSRLSPQCHETITPSRSISNARKQAAKLLICLQSSRTLPGMFASECARRDVQIH